MDTKYYPAYLSEDDFVKFWQDYYRNHQWTEKDDLSLYVHYPWCRSVCKFCVFGALKYDDHKNIISDYERAVLKMMEKMDPVTSTRTPNEIYFGGGTPSLWTYDSLREMTKVISNYDKIKIRRTEVHPCDLTPERIDFLINVMRFEHVSIGVQSFDLESNYGQNRIPIDPKKLTDAVREFQKCGSYVNVDLVAMFNGDDPGNWDIFRNDLEIAANMVKPDELTVHPNYRSGDYYGISVEFRKIIKEFADHHPEYHLNYGDWGFSLDRMDILRFMDSPYLFLTKDYSEFAKKHPSLKEVKRQEELDNRNIVAFGGIQNEVAFSRTSEFNRIDGLYQPYEKEFVFKATKESMFERLDKESEEELYDNSFYVGHFKLPPPKRID